VLAGPTVGRTLAEHGAEVLLVNSPRLPNVGGFVMDTSHGKRSALVDLDTCRRRREAARSHPAPTCSCRATGPMPSRRGSAPKRLPAPTPASCTST
jgi:hypothetical protein